MPTEPERYIVVRGKNRYHMNVTLVHDPEAIRRVDEFLLRCLLAKLPEIYARRAKGESVTPNEDKQAVPRPRIRENRPPKR